MYVNKLNQKKMVFPSKKNQEAGQYPTKIITDADYADDLVLFTNTPVQSESLLHSAKMAARDFGYYLNFDKKKKCSWVLNKMVPS